MSSRLYDDPNTARLVDEVLPAALPDFLPTQRWFGGKARTIDRIAVADLAWLPGGSQRNGLALVEISYAAGPADRYGVIVGVREDPGNLPVIARPDETQAMWVVEAVADHEGGHALLAGFVATPVVSTLRGGSLQYGDVTGLAVHASTAGVPIRSIGAEQSNSSIRVGADLVFKLLRRIEGGENPEIEISRFLTTRTAFRAMPALHGSLTYVDPAGAAGSIGVMQAWVESRGDGWNHVLAALEAHLRDGAPLDALRQDLGVLGATTADFHVAMASDPHLPGFAPAPATARDVEEWATELQAHAALGLDLLPHADLTPDLRERLEQALSSLVADRSAVVPRIGQTASDAFPRIRIHGDYHLGQTLKTSEGFVLLDFEGEPTRPLVERRRKQSALKDVAGMLRSFEYAVETACATQPELADELRVALDARGYFLDGYFGSALGHERPVVPADAEARRGWLRFLELEKALYELDYEVNNRPAWAHIPARGILQLLKV